MSVKSAERVLRIFELLSSHVNGLSIKEISETLELPQSSTSALVHTLYRENYLSVNQAKKFALGPKLISIGNAARESLDLASLSTESLQRLALAVEETVFMALLANQELVYVAKIDSNRSIRTSAYLGGRKPLYCTGLGKAFLTFMPEEQRIDYLEHLSLKPITANTITDKGALLARLQEFAKLGYAIDDEENEEGLYCVAAPIFDASRAMQAAISVAGPKERMLRQKSQIVNNVIDTANGISQKLGYVL
ncbi:IclR family transcriptional regulator [Shouchella clausii]|uniref:IclR family transcriptional regulator n=1 Tax=Shouchella clausii TaxID=79880 RepID=A0A268NY48_SHOCL|nr:IclR family transcriptional regulator [Shouchella clausii]PAE88437.1 IclR family transcriptional regulator [Shouchella clausii]